LSPPFLLQVRWILDVNPATKTKWASKDACHAALRAAGDKWNLGDSAVAPALCSLKGAAYPHLLVKNPSMTTVENTSSDKKFNKGRVFSLTQSEKSWSSGVTAADINWLVMGLIDPAVHRHPTPRWVAPYLIYNALMSITKHFSYSHCDVMVYIIVI
jgi:hypothetical protein